MVWKIVFRKLTNKNYTLFLISSDIFFQVQMFCVTFLSRFWQIISYTNTSFLHWLFFWQTIPNQAMTGKLNLKIFSLSCQNAALLLVFMLFNSRKPFRCWRGSIYSYLLNIVITLVWFSDSPNYSILETSN